MLWKLSLLLTVWVVGVLTGCVEKVVGSGTVKSETRQVEAFHGVEVRGPLEALVSQDPTATVKIEADDNLVPLITTQVQDGTLIVDITASRVSSKNPLKIEIAAPELDHLNLGGPGTLVGVGEIHSTSMSLRCGGSGKLSVSGEFETVESDFGGSGEMVLKGTAGEASYRVGGSGTLDASELQVAGPYGVQLAGSGTVAVWADGPLDVTLAGSGSVTYKGNTEKPNTTITGTGAVTRVP
ncbi:MAG: head GIN domain-containing protein [Vulcanimicrobiota bacterium]